MILIWKQRILSVSKHSKRIVSVCSDLKKENVTLRLRRIEWRYSWENINDPSLATDTDNWQLLWHWQLLALSCLHGACST